MMGSLARTRRKTWRVRWVGILEEGRFDQAIVMFREYVQVNEAMGDGPENGVIFLERVKLEVARKSMEV